jgi:hypothetical protein
VRILHIVHACDDRPGPGHDPQVLACRAALDACTRHHHLVCLLASTRAAARAALLGLEPTLRLAPFLGRPSLSANTLRRLAARLPPFDLVQCWDPTLLPLARRAVGPRLPITSATPAALEIAPDTPSTRSHDAHTHRRRSLRARLGVLDHTPVVALLSESPTAGDAEAFSVFLALCDASGLTACGIVQRGAASLHRARQLRRQGGFRFSMIITHEPVWRLLPACDAALLAPAPSSRPPLRRACVLLAHRAGIPVLALHEPALADLYPGELAQRLLTTRRSPDSRGLLLARLLAEGPQGPTPTLARRHAADPDRLRAVRETLEQSWDHAAELARDHKSS